MSRDLDILAKKVGEKTGIEILQILKQENAHLTITKGRITKHGDYRIPQAGKPHRLSLNGNLGPNQFLLTFLHEYAHLLAFKIHGRHIQPHGLEWKKIFSEILHQWVQKGVFTDVVAIQILRHTKNPTASTLSDSRLFEAVRKADQVQSQMNTFLKDLPPDSYFYLNGNYFLKGKKRRTRYVCREIATRREFLVHELAEVIPITNSLNP